MRLIGLVLDGILLEDQLQGLADRYASDKDIDLRFAAYQARL